MKSCDIIKIGDNMIETDSNNSEDIFRILNEAVLDTKQLVDNINILKTQISLQNKVLEKHNKRRDNKSLIELKIRDIDAEVQKYQQYLTMNNEQIPNTSEISIYHDRLLLKIEELKQDLSLDDSLWLDIAISVFNRIDLSPYTNHQLMCYLCALENGFSKEDIIKMMNPARDIGHLEQLFFNNLDDSMIQYLINNP